MSTWWERRLNQPHAPSQSAPQQYAPLAPLPTPKPPVSPEDLCPDCGSENYLAATKLTAKRCYDCGYPVVQSGTGLSSGRTDGTTKKAAQVQTGGYSPGVIVGRVE